MPPSTSLVVGWLDPGTVAGPFAESVTRLAAYELAKGRFVTTLRIESGPQLCEGRNLLARQFLDDTDAEWLLMVDSDMVFAHDTAERLLDSVTDRLGPVDRAGRPRGHRGDGHGREA